MDRRRTTVTLVLLALAGVACGGGLDGTVPVDGAQGSANSSLIRSDAGVLVDPGGRYAWVRHEGSLYAVSATAGTLSLVHSLEGMSDVRLAFLSGDQALLIADDPDGCPFVTSACTSVTRVDTVAATLGETMVEGSTLSFSVQSPSGRFVALTGGFDSSGVFLAGGATGDLASISWEGMAGGAGWSGCAPGECDERLWLLRHDGIRSWRVTGNAIAELPDVTIEGECDSTYHVYDAAGGVRPVGLVATSASGRYVALTCGRTFGVFDTHTNEYEQTAFNGPVAFSGETIAGHFRALDDDGYGGGGPGESCIQIIDPSVPHVTDEYCLPAYGDATYYASASGAWIVASTLTLGSVAMWVLDLQGGWDEIPGHRLVDGQFVERVAAHELWFVDGGSLRTLHADEPAVESPGLPYGVRDLNILPSQDRLALLTSSHVVFYSVENGLATAIELP